MATPTQDFSSQERVSAFLSGRVIKTTLPQIQGRPAASVPRLKRLMLNQGELAHFWDGPEPIHYLAFLELRGDTIRGNHYHFKKREFVYLISGEVLLYCADTVTGVRETIPLRAGDLVDIAVRVAHAYKVVAAGQALEFSEAPFDAADLSPFPLT